MREGANVEVVRRALLAQNRGDFEAFSAALDPHVRWDVGRNHVGLPTVLEGREDVVAAARAAHRRGGLVLMLQEVDEHGDDVLVLGMLRGPHGVTMPRAWIIRVRDGRAVHVRAFGGRTAALSAWRRRERAGER
jgi:ketosteroid isomerase-like protein